MHYRYPHFSLEAMREERCFTRGPAPGDPFPHFGRPDTDGRLITRNNFLGYRPILMTFASISCPMTSSSLPALVRLWDKYKHQALYALARVAALFQTRAPVQRAMLALGSAVAAGAALVAGIWLTARTATRNRHLSLLRRAAKSVRHVAHRNFEIAHKALPLMSK